MPKTCANDKCACDEGCACCPKDKSSCSSCMCCKPRDEGKGCGGCCTVVLPAALRVDVKVVIANASRTSALCHTKWRLVMVVEDDVRG